MLSSSSDFPISFLSNICMLHCAFFHPYFSSPPHVDELEDFGILGNQNSVKNNSFFIKIKLEVCHSTARDRDFNFLVG